MILQLYSAAYKIKLLITRLINRWQVNEYVFTHCKEIYNKQHVLLASNMLQNTNYTETQDPHGLNENAGKIKYSAKKSIRKNKHIS